MDIVSALKIIAALLTALFGLLAIVRPATIAELSHLQTVDAVGVGEIRIFFGGLLIGLGVGAVVLFALQSPAGYQLLGIGYGAAALTRLILMGRDRQLIIRATAIAFTYELVSAIILLLPGA